MHIRHLTWSTSLRTGVLAVALAASLTAPAASQPAPGGTPAGPPSPAERVAKLTGPDAINDTIGRWEVKATDLGIMWDNGRGQVLTAFGDTHGLGWTGPGGGVGDPATLDWRCNTLARSSDRDLGDGMTYTSMAEDRPGHAGELLDCRKSGNDDNGEVTVIPTAAISVGGRQYIHYMSVNHWGEPGHWETNYAGIAYSDDNGETWTKDRRARWQNTPAWDNKFQMAAMVREDGHVYLYGTPNGRYGDVHLARVPEHRVLEPKAYRYWNGRHWGRDQAAAAPVAADPAGELSVQYSRYLGKWVMMYLNETRRAIVMRTAPEQTGPWAPEQIVAHADQYPGLYGSYIHPRSADSGSPYLYFTMSQWDPYNVYLMRTRLSSGDKR
ncbi:DUF4185 domain-containing protein [Streptomyces sp. WMMC500]|uniref:DUF4185 domain-containing protein n=1 Tax=Streptomyces sp. WMMC500 TaxID=3015154 RepID=UPI00248B3B0C|nr:DUF4185 domain-containing protein [Streptomyces sp. WMMC500]WBB62896.1 DUF4185 domain-containing protein [Streptomyces sp. WMMC500]